MPAILKAGYGFSVGNDFARVKVDTPIELAPEEYAKPRHIIGYIAGNPDSSLGFLRCKRVRCHCSIDSIQND